MRALKLHGGNNLHSHDRLENDGLGALVRLTKRADGGELESKFGRINRMRGTVLEDVSDTMYRVPAKRTLFQRFKEALMVRSMPGVCP